MNPKALKSLEYYKIIDQLTEKASSQMGKDLCRHLLPSARLASRSTMRCKVLSAGVVFAAFSDRKSTRLNSSH